ncbi:MAG: hypothetical protein K2K57_13575 [Oscillospiraceae bacterium]|nr:hypothetical protein [Oscillospiraceae bacterium]
MDYMGKFYDVIVEQPVINVNSTELPGWAMPALIICGVVIAAAVIAKIVKGKR